MKETAGIISLIERALTPKAQAEIEEIGTVIGVGDGICKVYGLTSAVFGELVLFESGARGLVMDLDEDYVSVILLDLADSVSEQEIVKRTGSSFRVPVGDSLVGRVMSAAGEPLDELGPIVPAEMRPIERVAPGIIMRTPVSQPLETGCLVIDALIPIGKGQRELLIGNRSTGKTTTALNTIINQKGKNVVCIYVTIGHKQSDTAKIVHLLEEYDALSYTIVVDAGAGATALEQFLSPYAGCSIGEYFMDKGQDVLIVYDDLSNHAVAYRELSLLLRRPPGREAYPGDIFYIHSRLLERAGKLHADFGGGSMTALPLAQTQGDDISAYIATNLISITDGQVFFDTNMFNNGIRPAINIGLSVSRVGGAAQIKSMKKVAGTLKLELAQFEALSAFMQFGSELDATSQRAIDRGQRAIQLLKQDLHATYSQYEEIVFLFLLQENFFDRLEMGQISAFSRQFVSYLLEIYPQVHHAVTGQEGLSELVETSIRRAAEEFILVFTKPKDATY